MTLTGRVAILLLTLILGPRAMGQSLDRGPANYVPNDEVMASPYLYKLSFEDIFRPDGEGILEEAKKNVYEWEKISHFEQSWGVDSWAPNARSSRRDRKRYLAQAGIKYLDRRLSGEIKRAKKGSTLSKIGQVERSLSPRSSFKIGERYDLKVSGRVLLATIKVELKNPYVQNEVKIRSGGRVRAQAKKNFNLASLRVHSEINFDLKEKKYEAVVESPMYKQIVAKASRAQFVGGRGPSSSSWPREDNRIELVYKTIF